MQYPTVTRNIMVDALAPNARWFSLHFAEPDENGSNEITSVPRKQGTWLAAVDGEAKLQSRVVLTGVPEGVTADFIGVWSAETGGTFRCADDITNVVFQVPGGYAITDARLTIGGIVVNDPPVAPSSVSVQVVSSSSLTVSWVASTGATSYDVYHRVAPEELFEFVTTTSNTSYTDIGLPPSTLVEYYIVAKNSAGMSAPSATASATTQAVQGSPPGAPTGLALSSIQANQMTATWNAGSNAESYNIERDSAGTWVLHKSVAASVLSTALTGLSPSTSYTFRVVAVNSAGSTVGTTPASATATTTSGVPPKGTGLALQVLSSSSIKLTWDATPGATYYRVQRSLSGTTGSWSFVGPASITDLFWTDTGLSASTKYWYRFIPYNANGNGEASDAVAATTDSSGTGTNNCPSGAQTIPRGDPIGNYINGVSNKSFCLAGTLTNKATYKVASSGLTPGNGVKIYSEWASVADGQGTNLAKNCASIIQFDNLAKPRSQGGDGSKGIMYENKGGLRIEGVEAWGTIWAGKDTNSGGTEYVKGSGMFVNGGGDKSLGGVVLRHCNIHDHQKCASTGGWYDVQNCDIHHCGSAAAMGFSSCGIKMGAVGNGSIFKNGYWHENHGNGLWWDCQAAGATVDNNLFWKNVLVGVMYEVSGGAKSQSFNNTTTPVEQRINITNNRFFGNNTSGKGQRGGVAIWTSKNVLVDNNEFKNNVGGKAVFCWFAADRAVDNGKCHDEGFRMFGITISNNYGAQGGELGFSNCACGSGTNYNITCTNNRNT